jgi:glucose/arabinose dehydrogenase
MKTQTAVLVLSAALLLGCAGKTKLPPIVGFGPNPVLPPPQTAPIPVVNVLKAAGWPEGGKPTSPSGTEVTAFAKDFDHPRWIYVLPNGDVLVAETNAPPRPEDMKGLKGAVMKQVMKRTGAAVPSANRITLLRDADGDGVAEVRERFLEGLSSPFGMVLVGNELYVANADALVRVPYNEGETKITAAATTVATLPGGPINHHWTKNVVANKDGSKLYVSVGSNSNVAENGIEAEQGRAAIWEIDRATGDQRIFASGLRNPVGMAWEPSTGTLWTAVNERDELGNDLPPDFMTSVKEGGFYGFPYSYFGPNVDERVKPQRPELVARAIVPDYALGAHTASLGLAWSGPNRLPAQFAHGMFVGQHGSWNRNPRSGYKVIFVPFEGSRAVGNPIDVLTGFVSPDGEAYGRPVGVAIDKSGGLLVADDVGNVVWRVTGSPNVSRR